MSAFITTGLLESSSGVGHWLFVQESGKVRYWTSDPNPSDPNPSDPEPNEPDSSDPDLNDSEPLPSDPVFSEADNILFQDAWKDCEISSYFFSVPAKHPVWKLLHLEKLYSKFGISANWNRIMFKTSIVLNGNLCMVIKFFFQNSV